jgi:hypothetical protein
MASVQCRDGVERLRLLAARALRRPRGARGEDDRLALFGRRRQIGDVAVLDQLVQRLVGAVGLGLVPGDEALAALRRPLEHLAELLVEDDRDGVLALGHVGELGAGERGVHEERVGPELVRGHVRLDPAAVVAAHDRDGIPGLDALLREGVRERVGALVDLLERERAALVDQAEVVRVAGGGGLVAGGGRRAPAHERDGGVEEAIRPLRADDAGAGERGDGLELAGELPRARWLHGEECFTPAVASTPVAPRQCR